jgi:hypothetical protein
VGHPGGKSAALEHAMPAELDETLVEDLDADARDRAPQAARAPLPGRDSAQDLHGPLAAEHVLDQLHVAASRVHDVPSSIAILAEDPAAGNRRGVRTRRCLIDPARRPPDPRAREERP